jgi:predicted RNase H-like HicB family nuclease
VKVGQVVRLIEHDGWQQVAQRGSHLVQASSQTWARHRRWQILRRLGARHPQQHIEAGCAQRENLMRYAVVIERAEGNYSACVPDLPGCVATGATVPEVEGEIRAAIRFHIEGLRADGLSVPEPSSLAEYVEA